MFRKAQLKLFAIIAGILLAVFIAVLGSINVIMKFVMENQSRSALKQIAASVEYDDTAMEFYYTPSDNESDPPKEPPNDHGEAPPFKPDATKASDAAVPPTTETTTSVTTSTAVTTVETTEPTEAVTETDIPETEHYEPATEAAAIITEPAPTIPPVVTQAPATAVQPPKTTAVQATTPKPPAVTKAAPKTTEQPKHEEQRPPEDKKDDKKPDDKKDNNNDNNNNNNGQQGWQQPNGGWYGFGPCPDPGYWGGFWNPYPYYWGSKPKDEVQPEKNGQDNDADATQPAGVSMTDDNGYIMQLGNIANVTTSTTTSTPAATTMPKRKQQNRRGTEPVPKSLGPTEFFIVMADESGNYISKQNNDDLSSENAQKYITEILNSGESTGMLNNFQFYQQDKDNGTIFVFTDKTAEMDMLHKLTRTTIMIGSLAFILLSVVSFYLSGLVMKPLKIAFEKQKQFVSDASHELKTPVTVISANADVLAGEIGENKWLTYIKSQTERMNVLVNDLLNLTRLENNTSTDFIRSDFDLSKAIVNTALPFECQAFESNKNFVVQVDEGIKINGSEKHIKQMAAIFIDNALKYSKDGGLVRVSLVQDGDKKIFSVYNTGQGVKEEDKDKIFERFFRSDESRNRATGGYGLGLAIAKSIIDKHKFKVQVENVEGRSICFVITMQ